MPKSYTDSSTIEHHDDGTWTETTTITYQPPTKAQKAAAWTGLGACLMIAVAPLGVAMYEVVQDYREERKQRKLAKKETEQ